MREMFSSEHEKFTESEARDTLAEMYDISGEDADKIIGEMYTYDWISKDYYLIYNGVNVYVIEADDYYHIDFGTGLGEALYPKEDWTLEAALEDQFKI